MGEASKACPSSMEYDIAICKKLDILEGQPFLYLVGGLEHFFFHIGNNHPN